MSPTNPTPQANPTPPANPTPGSAPAAQNSSAQNSPADVAPSAARTSVLQQPHRLPLYATALLALSALCVVATWTYLVWTQPTDSNWEALADSASSTIALVGFLTPAIIALAVLVPRLPVRTLALMPVALAANVVLGQIIGTMGLPLPLYMDSIGTVLVGALAGPAAGMTTGVVSALVWGTFNPTVVPFAAAYAFVGVAAGLLRKLFVSAWWKLALAALVVGFITALLSAPVASFIFGGTAGTGTGLLVSAYRSLGFDTMTAVFLQSWTSDPLDKLIVFSVVYLVVRALPQRARRAFAA